MIQVSILKINDYGPWTLTLGSDREHELQILQASLYENLQRQFSEKNCLVFLNRSDEFFVISNNLSLEDHIEVQKNLEKKFEIRLSISIGFADSPFEANKKAYEGKKNKISLNVDHNIFGFVDNSSQKEVTIMHFDVDNLSSKRKTFSPFEISSIIFSLYSKMIKFFIEKNSLSFFMGGDNFMVVASINGKKNAKEFIDLIKKDDGILLNCGIGTGKTSREAASLATKSLDTIREIRDSGKEKPEVFEI
ncbi:MAG: GTP cyclohydrolase IIa [Nitrosopumilus sp.]|nr:GTP cyclohydrolase IIa [Nitrosopumilus sp.]MDH3384556.1 GTP cyclohydrolase IIa [Nitrosopumilus sp.]